MVVSFPRPHCETIWARSRLSVTSMWRPFDPHVSRCVLFGGCTRRPRADQEVQIESFSWSCRIPDVRMAANRHPPKPTASYFVALSVACGVSFYTTLDMPPSGLLQFVTPEGFGRLQTPLLYQLHAVISVESGSSSIARLVVGSV